MYLILAYFVLFMFPGAFILVGNGFPIPSPQPLKDILFVRVPGGSVVDPHPPHFGNLNPHQSDKLDP